MEGDAGVLPDSRPDTCVALRQSARFRDGRLTDVPIAEALTAVMSPEAKRFVMDAMVCESLVAEPDSALQTG